MNYCIRCDFDPCVCIKEPMQSLTIEVDKETYKFIEQRAGSNSVGEQAARMLTIHHVLDPCPCDPSVYPSEPTTAGLTTIETEINKDTYSSIFAGHSVEDQAARILAAHASIQPRPAGDQGWMGV